MEKYVINGGKPLQGEVEISGAKNAAVAIIPAALMVDGICRIENIPEISDTDMLLKILSQLGAKVRLINRSTIEIDSRNVKFCDAPFDLMRKIRASYYLIGAMLSRFGHAKTTMPGGCNFGVRPIDQHIKGMMALGADIEVKSGFVFADAPEGGLHGAKIYLDKVSVGATMNIILAATTASGRTIIENAAREPHIVDLANFLNSMGADIRGAGTDTVKINGVDKLRGGSYSIIPDQIEAGTYMVAAAATAGEVLIKNIIPKHMECISAKLRETGTIVQEYEDSILVKGNGQLRKANIKTLPYPGFPTDMQPQIAVCMSLASGVSVITESIYDTRFGYCAELNRMGAAIKVDTKVAIITGVDRLHGCTVRACDLRAGAAMVIAGLAAEGRTTIEEVEYIERGYENLIGKLQGIGATIKRVETPAPRTASVAG
ncbi:MAG: UDP-N-acetylglucosamine 1-carboxyvinyltransferase [Clostridiales bacterium]|nr:UDP-N-acetylglucosamine 1-carboxyvinyltransferase [Clostridiales bacterium]